MIERYARPEMTAIWSAASKYRIWFEIEAHGCDALAEIGVIPKSAAKNIWDRGGSAEFDVAKIDEIEREVKHDVIAFLTHLASFIGDDARRASGVYELRYSRHDIICANGARD